MVKTSCAPFSQGFWSLSYFLQKLLHLPCDYASNICHLFSKWILTQDLMLDRLQVLRSPVKPNTCSRTTDLLGFNSAHGPKEWPCRADLRAKLIKGAIQVPLWSEKLLKELLKWEKNDKIAKKFQIAINMFSLDSTQTRDYVHSIFDIWSTPDFNFYLARF